MLTKLKYVGTKEKDLVTIYIIFIRCLLEYCSVVWHSALTKEQTNDIERVQVVCLKVIIGKNYEDYNTALLQTSLESLESRRNQRCLAFGLRCLEHPKHREMFPLNGKNIRYPTRSREIFQVNKARTQYYILYKLKPSFCPEEGE